jgi:hypothetical protein
MIRGTIGTNGEILAGSGFQVSHTQTGIYHITFDTAFAGDPSVTATAYYVDFLASAVATSSTAQVDLEFIAQGHLESGRFDFIVIGPR